jgi:hypothetical protein
MAEPTATATATPATPPTFQEILLQNVDELVKVCSRHEKRLKVEADRRKENEQRKLEREDGHRQLEKGHWQSRKEHWG